MMLHRHFEEKANKDKLTMLDDVSPLTYEPFDERGFDDAPEYEPDDSIEDRPRRRGRRPKNYDAD